MVYHFDHSRVNLSCCFHALWYTHLNALVLIHAGGVIHCQQHLILPLTWLGSSQPDPVVLEVAGNVRYYSPHVQSLASPIVTSVSNNQGKLIIKEAVP